jgi:hypothetical protein
MFNQFCWDVLDVLDVLDALDVLDVRSILLGSSLIRTHFERVGFSAQEQR